ncbi:MAG: bifunctional oligoribonuclease/PAP phosphatase NrnA [Erysipelotrichaceae bacterium]|nr:bifunctional oligoribonuclease/PAP phosphatase NrnA [Erysipelotrichaceae bacterium]
MYKEILRYIKEYDSIIITRHLRPDLDALGSQLGLKQLILDNFPHKKVYAVGDMSRKCFLGEMDEIDDSVYDNSLLIITDVSVINMLCDIPYKRAKSIICIDHHHNECNIENAKAFYNVKAAAACQIIAEFAFNNNLYVSNNSAICLYTGIISDTNRFNFSLSKDLFDVCGKLIDLGFNYSEIYNIIYNEKVSNVKMKAYFMDKFIVDENKVAYLKNDAAIFKRFPVDFFSISRGMVNVMANLDGVEIWCNFTQDPENNKIVCEFRSKRIPIVEIAKKYGGGGHLLACGATVDSFEVVDEIIKDFDNLAKES